MILYFSGTGNSKWIASQLAKKLNDKSYDICTIDDEIDLTQEKQILKNTQSSLNREL